MPTAAASSFDIAYWFIDKAKAENAPLPAMKLQRLLFLSQAYFAASTRGERLMPSMFVTTEQGPVEPNLVRLHDIAAENVETLDLRESVVKFLDGMWAAFGGHTLVKLDDLVLSNEAVRDAMRQGANTEVSTVAMHNHFGKDIHHSRVLGHFKPEKKEKIPIPKYHRGRPVKKWLPGMKRVQG